MYVLASKMRLFQILYRNPNWVLSVSLIHRYFKRQNGDRKFLDKLTDWITHLYVEGLSSWSFGFWYFCKSKIEMSIGINNWDVESCRSNLEKQVLASRLYCSKGQVKSEWIHECIWNHQFPFKVNLL